PVEMRMVIARPTHQRRRGPSCLAFSISFWGSLAMKNNHTMKGMLCLVVVLVTVACSDQQGGGDAIATVYSREHAVAPYFTKDTSGNPVLCWTGTAAGDSVMYYSAYDQKIRTFETPI